MKKLLLFLLSVAATLYAWGQTSFAERYNLSVLDMRTGLPNNHVDALLTDSYGFIWIASQGGGLLKYDGYTFYSPTVYNMGFSPRSNSCRSLSEDGFHRLWVSYEEGTDVIDLVTMRKLSPFPNGHADIDSILARPAVGSYCDSKGNMWLVARTYIYYISFDAEGNPQKPLAYAYESGNAPVVRVRDVEGNGTVWAAVDGGLYKLVPRGNSLQRQDVMASNTELHSAYVSDFLRQEDFIWASTVNGLYRYDIHSHQLDHYTHTADPASLSHNAATCLTLLPDGTLLVGTLCGLNIYHPQTNSFEHLTTTSPTPLSSDYVTQVFLLGQQIWIATETGGITRLTPRQLQLRNFAHHADSPSSLSANAVNAMYVEADGTLWVGTVEGGLNRREPGQDGFAHLTTANSALPHNSVSTLCADNQGRLWVGTWGGGLCTVDLATDRLSVFSSGNTFDNLLQYIGALAFDPFNNGLWIGANTGLFFYDFATATIREPFEGCRDVRGCIGSLVTAEGELWMGCLDGARVVSLKKRDARGRFPCRAIRYRLDDPDSRVIEKISCFYQAHDGTLWLGSNEYGLYHRTIDKSGHEHFTRYTMQQGLANNAVKGIVEDGHGQFWITTNYGLSLLNPDAEVFANYGVDDGLLSEQFYWNSAVKGPDGTIFLGSVRGLTELTGIDQRATIPVRKLRFTHLTVDNEDATADSRYIDADISQVQLLRLHESNKSIVLSFSALNYASENSGTYSYRLRGLDKEWTQLPAGEHSVRYTSLPSGSFRLEVRYDSAYSDEESELLTLNIEVTPYFWHSWWFLSGLLILLVALASWLYRQRMMKLSARIKKEEERRLMEPIEKAVRESRNPEQMQARIQDILHIQQRLEESTNKTAEADNEEARLKEVPFMDRVMTIMEQNYKNSEFGVQQMCEAMGMSRSLLSKRLNVETGMPASQFIRNYRLNIAHELLQRKNQMRNVADIAFSVGFNDPKYFTRCFHRQYGVPPSSFTQSAGE
jgi:ligand-binding sensor domain-containing protein/AraC-like DNA-binding protein